MRLTAQQVLALLALHHAGPQVLKGLQEFVPPEELRKASKRLDQSRHGPLPLPLLTPMPPSPQALVELPGGSARDAARRCLAKAVLRFASQKLSASQRRRQLLLQQLVEAITLSRGAADALAAELASATPTRYDLRWAAHSEERRAKRGPHAHPHRRPPAHHAGQPRPAAASTSLSASWRWPTRCAGTPVLLRAGCSSSSGRGLPARWRQRRLACAQSSLGGWPRQR